MSAYNKIGRTMADGGENSAWGKVANQAVVAQRNSFFRAFAE